MIEKLFKVAVEQFLFIRKVKETLEVSKHG
jgi:hypothetical protein